MSRAPKHTRRKPLKETAKSTVFICEDTTSSPPYIKYVCELYGLQNYQVITGNEYGSSPKSIVSHAKDLLQQNTRKYRKGEDLKIGKIFCIIDTLEHENGQTALAAINSASSHSEIEMICLTPCFEFWLILHFCYTEKPLTAHEAVKELKKHIPDFGKNKQKTLRTEDLRDILIPKLECAQQNSQALEKAQERMSSDKFPNPDSRMHYLIDYIKSKGKKRY